MAGEKHGYLFFAVVASSLLACSFPFSPLLLQHYVVFKAAPFEGHPNFRGAVCEYSAARTEILTLHHE